MRMSTTSQSSCCGCAGDAVALELAAAEMAQAAAVFVALEKEMDKLRAKGADGGIIALKDTARCATVEQHGVRCRE
jgi:hypothetical protein